MQKLNSTTSSIEKSFDSCNSMRHPPSLMFSILAVQGFSTAGSSWISAWPMQSIRGLRRFSLSITDCPTRVRVGSILYVANRIDYLDEHRTNRHSEVADTAEASAFRGQVLNSIQTGPSTIGTRADLFQSLFLSLASRMSLRNRRPRFERSNGESLKCKRWPS